MEILDQTLIEVEEETKGTEASMMAFSLSYFLGQSCPTTTKLRGAIKKNQVVVMIDSGATHNFISPSAVQKTRLAVTANENLCVMLGTGISVKGTGVCKDVRVGLPDMSFTADFVVLELGNVDIILRVQWLRTLGKCVVDWERNEWSFCYKGSQVTLVGDPTLHGQRVSLKTLVTETTLEKKGVKMEVRSMEAVKELPVAINKTLLQYDEVFQKPVGLPPIRGREHAIVLQDNAKPISVRPYRYPQAHKEVMERMVQEMLDEGLIRPS